MHKHLSFSLFILIKFKPEMVHFHSYLGVCKENVNNANFTHIFAREASRNFGNLIGPNWKKKQYGFSSIPYFVRLINEG